MPSQNRHSATIGGAGVRKKAKVAGLNHTSSPALGRNEILTKIVRSSEQRSGRRSEVNATISPRSELGESVLLLENRFFRPGGIRVGTIEKMMFRPGLAPDHHSPPPAFRRTNREALIPYSKGRPYRKEIGVSKLAATSDKREDTRMKLVQMLGGRLEAPASQNSKRKTSTVPRSRNIPSRKIGGQGGRPTKLVNGKESQGRRPRSRHNWNRLAIEKSAGTIWGYSGCSVLPEDLAPTKHL